MNLEKIDNYNDLEEFLKQYKNISDVNNFLHDKCNYDLGIGVHVEMIDLRYNIERLIRENVKDEKRRKVLEMFFLRCYDVETIKNDIGINSTGYLYRLRSEGINEILENIQKRKNKNRYPQCQKTA